jgi:hypothetical protein
MTKTTCAINRAILAVTAALLVASGCDGCQRAGSGWPWNRNTGANNAAQTNDAGGRTVIVGAGNRTVSADRGERPEEDSYSVLLMVFRDPATHVKDATDFQERLAKHAKWKGLFVLHKLGHSELYWGRYPTVDAAAKNLTAAKAYRPPSGQPIFAQAITVPLPKPDIGPPEHNLKNAKGAYSLLVAVFKDVPEIKYYNRRQKAVQACEALRKEGYEAYFHHGPAVSDVTIGTFKPDSVRVVWRETGAQLEILDPQISRLQQRFEWLLMNGNTISFIRRDPRTGQAVSKERRRTYLVRIPGYEGSDVLP